MVDRLGPQGDFQRTVFEAPMRGVWTHESPLSSPAGMTPTLTNCELFGDVVRSMLGNAKFIASAWPSGAITLLVDYRSPTADPVILLGSTSGIIWRWDAGGGTWVTLRQGLSTTATLWWATQQYGTDLFMTNPTDGVYRWDGTALLPIGAKLITRCEASEAGDWTNETTDAVNFQEGLGAMKVAGGGAPSVLTYNPAAAIDTATPRLSAPTYALTKATGTDCYHFKVKFTNAAAGGATITAATTTFVITDTGAKSLTWPTTLWYTNRSKTATVSLTTNDWQDVYCFPADATEVATFNPTLVDKLEWKCTISAGATDMVIDDVYSIYQSTMPAVSYLAEWRNILFGARTTANPDALYWSATRAPDQWSALATAPIKGGGDSITALHAFFHQLTIGTDHHILTLSGSIIGQQYPAYLFDINEVTNECGISSHRSVVKVDNRLYFFYQSHIMRYTGTAVEDISYPIQETLLGLDASAVQYIVGARHRQTEQIWWTVRESGESANNLVVKYDYRHQAFLFSDLGTPWFYLTYASSDERLLSIDDTNRFVYRQYDTTPGYDHFGADIGYVIESPPLGLPDAAQEWIEAYVQYLSKTGTLTFKYRLADHLRALAAATYVTADTINQAVADEYGRIRLGFPARFVQLRIEATGQPFVLQFPIVVRSRMLGQERAFS